MLDVMEIDIDRPEKIVYVVGLGPGEPFYMTQQLSLIHISEPTRH